MPEMTYEGEHDGMTVIDADDQYVEVPRGGTANIADADVDARLAQGWTLASSRKTKSSEES